MSIDPRIYELSPREIELYGALTLIESCDPDAAKRIRALREKDINTYLR